MKTLWANVKWLVLAIIALIGTVLAVVYGKRTPQVLKSKLRSVKARESALKLEIDVTEAEARKRGGSEEAKRYIAKADTLSKKLTTVREAKAKALSETGDLEKMSDDDVAARDNARHRAASRP